MPNDRLTQFHIHGGNRLDCFAADLITLTDARSAALDEPRWGISIVDQPICFVGNVTPPDSDFA